MHPVNMLDAVMHFHRNLLPREEAEVALLQQGLQFNIGNGMDRGHYFLLQLYQIFHIAFQAFLNLDDLNTARSTLEPPRFGFLGMSL